MQFLSKTYEVIKQSRAVLAAVVTLLSGVFLAGVYFEEKRQALNESIKNLEHRALAIENKQNSIDELISAINQTTQALRSNVAQTENRIANLGRSSQCELVRVISSDTNVRGKPRCPAGWFVSGLDQTFASGSWSTYLEEIHCCPLLR